LIDPNHTYVFCTGDYGIKDYWYVDLQGNYWRYTNAPEDHKDFDAYAGIPLLVRTQPMPATAPGFFTPEGRKRHIAVPPGIIPDRNPVYDPLDSRSIWYEVFSSNGETRYVYLDADVRENLDLFVQYQLRVADASIPRVRSFAYQLFQQPHQKDKFVAAVIMLVDQGLYGVEELVQATVSDLEFIDETVKLLGRKFRCDPVFLDFLTSLVGTRDKDAPLFQLDTAAGRSMLGVNHLYSIFHFLRISPTYLHMWHASHMFSRIANRLLAEEVPAEDLEGRVFSELRRVFVTSQEIQFMVDYKVRSTVIENFKTMTKSLDLVRGSTDEYAVLMIFSDLNGRRDDELEFSEWLHAEPMHDVSPVQEVAVDAMLGDSDTADGDDGSDQGAEGAVDARGADVGTSDTTNDVGTSDKREVV
jgi:hypothetical protein